MSADGGLRALFRQHLTRAAGWEWTAMETGGTASGVPDVFWGHAPTRTRGWIECKKTDGWAVEFRPHQLAWLARYGPCGARTHVAVLARGRGSAEGRGAALWLLEGSQAEALARHGLRGPDPAARWLGAPSEWDWESVGSMLRCTGEWS